MSIFPSHRSDPELAPFRAGLVFGFFNALTWQIGIGTPMVLFAEQLGASPAEVGLAYAFVFLLTPVQIASTALLPRHGFKTVMLGGWGTRSIFLAVPLTLAVISIGWGPAEWMAPALVASVFFFCLFRSVGAAAITPWLYSILPVGIRGRYFANDQFLSAISGVLTLLVCAALFALLPIYTALLVQYAIALTGSTLSYFALKRLPDAPHPVAISLRTVWRDTPRHLLARSPFRTYLWLSVWFFVLSTPIPPFSAYYLKVGGHLGAGQIMLFEVARYCGVLSAAWAIRRRIDATGAKPFLLIGVGLYALVAVFWLAYLRLGGGGGAVVGIYLVYFLLGCGAACWTVANLNYLPKVVPDQERTLMVSTHGAVTAFLGGCAATLWGWFLKDGSATGPTFSVFGFELFFVSVLVSACVLSALCARLPEDNTQPVEPLVVGNVLLRPLRAASYLVTLIDLRGLVGPAAKAPPAPRE